MSDGVVYASIIYLALYRVSIIFVGAMSIYLGYKLFVKGITTEPGATGAGVEASFGETRFSMTNAAPGTFFSLFGIIVISVMIVNGPPEVSHNKKYRPHSAGQESAENQENTSQEQWTLRGTNTNQDNTRLGISLNNYAWDKDEIDDTDSALIFAGLANYVAPGNADILDTLAELLFKEKRYEEALIYKQ